MSGPRKPRNTNTLSGTDLTPSRQTYAITAAQAQPKNNNLLTKYFSDPNTASTAGRNVPLSSVQVHRAHNRELSQPADARRGNYMANMKTSNSGKNG